MVDLKILLTKMLDAMYPVGSIYISTNNVSPATFFGGTWVQIKGRFLLGTGTPDANNTAYWGTDITNFAGDPLNATAGEMGGESKHTLSVDQIPSHQHSIKAGYGDMGTASYDSYRYQNWGGYNNGWQTGDLGTNYAGSGWPHNNMPPYYAVYMWERTA